MLSLSEVPEKAAVFCDAGTGRKARCVRVWLLWSLEATATLSTSNNATERREHERIVPPTSSNMELIFGFVIFISLWTGRMFYSKLIQGVGINAFGTIKVI